MNSTLSTPACLGVGAGEVEHLVGHVDADRLAGRRDAAGGDEHVGAGAGAEVEHRLAGVEVGDGGRDPAAQRRGDGGRRAPRRRRLRRARRRIPRRRSHRSSASLPHAVQRCPRHRARPRRTSRVRPRGCPLSGRSSPAAQPQLRLRACSSPPCPAARSSWSAPRCAARSAESVGVSSAMRTAPSARRGSRSSRPTVPGARSRRSRPRAAP